MSDPTRTHGPLPEPDVTRTHSGRPPTDGETATGGDGASAVPASMPSTPPGFEILEELGRGGMGVVYKARQLKLNRLVALKMLLTADLVQSRDLLRFLAEAEAVAAVIHPHVVQVYEVGQHNGLPYMAFEYLPGGTLADLLRRRKASGDRKAQLDPREAAELLVKLAQAVQAAHDQGIVHRDLKPGNILFENAANENRNSVPFNQATTYSLSPAHVLRPKVADFGLAKRATGSDLTRTQAVMGTPAYMPPEQARGETKFVGPGADIYALGIILYECLTGTRPFEGDDNWAVLRRVIDEPPEPLRKRVPDVPRDLELITLKCLEKNPGDRYPTATALAEDLTRFLNGQSVSVRPAGTGERFVKWCKRNPTIAGLLAALLIVGLLGFAGVTWGLMRAEARGDDLAQKNDELIKSKAETLAINQQLEITANNLTQSSNALEKANVEVNRRAGEAEDRGYLSDVALANQLWKANDLRGMRAALERCPPSRRKWEWQYLDRLSRPEKEVIRTDSLPVSLAYSPDGKLLAYCTLQGKLTVRDLENNKDRFQFKVGPAPSRHSKIVFHPKRGELLYSTGSAVYVINLENGKGREVIPPTFKDDKEGHPGEYVAVGYAADGRIIGANVTRITFKAISFLIRDLSDGKRLATLVGPDAPQVPQYDLAAAAFDANGDRFSAIITDTMVRKRDLNEPPKKEEPFHPVMYVWDLKDGKVLKEVEASNNRLGSIAFSPDGGTLAVCRPGQAMEIPLQTNATPRIFSGHIGEVSAVAFDRNGLLWSGGEDRLIIAHNRKSGVQSIAIRGCQETIVRIAVSPDGKEVAAAVGTLTSGTGMVSRFDVVESLSDSWRAPGGDRVNFVLGMSPNAESVAITNFSMTGDDSDDNRLMIRNPLAGTLQQFKTSSQWLQGAFLPNGNLVVHAIKEQDRFHILAPDGSTKTTLNPPKKLSHALLSAVACSSDGKTIAAVSGYEQHRSEDLKPGQPTPLKVRLVTWNADAPDSGKMVEADLTASLTAEASRVLLLPLCAVIDSEGKRIAVAATIWSTQENGNINSFGAVLVWDLATREEVFRRVREEPLRSAVFTATDRLLVAGGAIDGKVVEWDLTTGKELLSFRGHSKPIQALAIGPDGRLATGGVDRVVKFWEMSTGRELMTLDGFSGEVTRLGFTRDGKSLIAATGVGLVSLFSMGGVGPSEWVPSEVKVFRGPK
ncbi:MAG TPA: protein kinase [Gemmata sp.]|nr:protein kinase [Gemmata sp.]